MKKRMLVVAAATAWMLVAGAAKADAHVGFSIGIGVPGIYIGPPAVYAPPAYYAPPGQVYYAPPVYYAPYPYYGGGGVYFGGRSGLRGHCRDGRRWSGRRWR